MSKQNSLLNYKGNPISEFPSKVPEIILDKEKDKFPDYGAPIPTYEEPKDLTGPSALWAILAGKIVHSPTSGDKNDNYLKEMMDIYHDR